MLTIKIDFVCQLCGCREFYIMPFEEKVLSNDTVTSNDTYKIKCKKCKKSYALKIMIGMI
jgi:hypothetical protein